MGKVSKVALVIIAVPVIEADTVARLGGDEFAVLLPQCPIPQAKAIADKLRVAIESYRLEGGARLTAAGPAQRSAGSM